MVSSSLCLSARPCNRARRAPLPRTTMILLVPVVLEQGCNLLGPWITVQKQRTTLQFSDLLKDVCFGVGRSANPNGLNANDNRALGFQNDLDWATPQWCPAFAILKTRLKTKACEKIDYKKKVKDKWPVNK